MRYFVVTSDKYNFFLEGYTKLFNKYWDSDIHVEILGFDEPPVELPDNFTFISLGKQSDWKDWSGPLIKFFNSIDDEYFFMCFEDHFLTDYVDQEKFKEALTYCDGTVDKVYLVPDHRKKLGPYKGNFFHGIDGPLALITTSLLPNIWKREFFLKLLLPNLPTPHQFEIRNHPKTFGCTIILSDSIIYPNVDCARSGRYNQKVIASYNSNRHYDYGVYRQPMQPESFEVFLDMKTKWNQKYGL